MLLILLALIVVPPASALPPIVLDGIKITVINVDVLSSNSLVVFAVVENPYQSYLSVLSAIGYGTVNGWPIASGSARTPILIPPLGSAYATGLIKTLDSVDEIHLTGQTVTVRLYLRAQLCADRNSACFRDIDQEIWFGISF
jgi:hypothetical protein